MPIRLRREVHIILRTPAQRRIIFRNLARLNRLRNRRPRPHLFNSHRNIMRRATDPRPRHQRQRHHPRERRFLDRCPVFLKEPLTIFEHSVRFLLKRQSLRRRTFLDVWMPPIDRIPNRLRILLYITTFLEPIHPRLNLRPNPLHERHFFVFIWRRVFPPSPFTTLPTHPLLHRRPHIRHVDPRRSINSRKSIGPWSSINSLLLRAIISISAIISLRTIISIRTIISPRTTITTTSHIPAISIPDWNWIHSRELNRLISRHDWLDRLRILAPLIISSRKSPRDRIFRHAKLPPIPPRFFRNRHRPRLLRRHLPPRYFRLISTRPRVHATIIIYIARIIWPYSRHNVQPRKVNMMCFF